ncbi:MAG: trehalose-phosphatase [Chloroflexota bacterium]
MTPLAMLRGALAAEPAGLVADYDGTLSPIVADPMAALPAPGAVAVLRELGRRLAVVAVITGRAPLDARRFLGDDSVLVAGNHGLEWLEVGSPEPEAAPSLGPARQAIAAAMTRVAALEAAGVVLEPKGISATVHYRGSPEPVATRAAILGAVGALDPAIVDLREGKMSVELRPAGAGDKGTALRTIVERFALRGIVVLGDDVTDLDMFRAAAALRDSGELTVCIGAVGAAGETPESVLEAADFIVRDPGELVALLREAVSPA